MLEPLRLPPCPDQCQLCRRGPMPLTKHHLIPRSVWHKPGVRDRFSKQDCVTRILWICRSCHNHIHACISERDMARFYHDLSSLMSRADVGEFCQWLSRKPPGFTPKQRPSL